MAEVGLKYCGGCNPRYDRAALARRLQSACPESRFHAAAPGVVYDVLVVLCGCSARCADLSGLAHCPRMLYLTGEESCAAALELLQG